ncbi:MAG TPA: hypothetical protein VF503_07180 [Sphingobium sp.]|uniref:hypothetical protein n=1 Tax=Sphingobium sp. TaxID=1912891 RepID=UPI002ED1360D
MSNSAKLRSEADARRLAFAKGSVSKIVVNPTPPTAAEIESWASENGVKVSILTSPTGKVEGIETTNDADNDRMMRWLQSRI